MNLSLMNILALDSCSEMCSVALYYQGQITEKKVLTERGHSELLLTMMEQVFADSGCALSDVDTLAFGRGPGSFTGVRVGVGVAQGIAYARDIPVVPVSSLAAVAQKAGNAMGQGYYAVAMDARMSEIYCAHYYFDGEIVSEMHAEQVCKPELMGPINGEQCYGVGSGWGVYGDVLQAEFGQQLIESYADYYPQAESIIQLAQKAIVAGDLLPAEQALPVYLRDNVAKKKVVLNG